MTESLTSSRQSNVVVRAAEGKDYEWVADLMERALSPFYGGDHRTHAKRIFDTHIQGGVDHVGHFSAGQHMFIAEVNGQQAGIIHVVQKKQGTAKISPLIVSHDYQGRLGVGSTLLQYAEQYALDLGARQLYCTVAEPNHQALSFFRRKGFYVTGTAKGHYRHDVDEHMLYKQLGSRERGGRSDVLVVPFDERHADGVRRLVTTTMSDNFHGVDDDWVNALFAGHERKREGEADVNAKYKIIFVAERDNRVIGVAGATPKKGNPIKLMPLVAADELAFEALILNLRWLLADYGHKLYVHLVPDARQVTCLQRNGWSLEGVFPAGYAPNSVVQQWGRSIAVQ